MFTVSEDQINPVSTKKEESKDPWANRSKGMVCATCVFFVEKKRETAVEKDPVAFGRCRRNAPTLKGFPAVFGNDWCGEHRLDENKLLLG